MIPVLVPTLPMPGHAASVTFSGIQLHYTFDSISPIADTSGNNNTGVAGGIVAGSTGLIGNALSLVGTGFVSFTSVAFFILTQTGPISCSCWIKTSTPDGVIFSLRNGGIPNAVLDFGIGFNAINNAGTGLPYVIIRGDDGIGLMTLNSTGSSLADGAWHHVAYTRNSSQLITIYADSIVVATGTDTVDTTITPSVASSAIGSDLNNGGPLFNGLIDDVQIYNVALTPTQITAIYNR